ncbi:MAG: hypothetical protein WBW03_17670 [Silvibacterium sp.]
MGVLHKIGVAVEIIKLEHLIFTLAIALTAAMLAASGCPRVYQFFWIVVCMIFARSARVAFTAGGAEPWQAHGTSFLHFAYIGTSFDHHAAAFVTGMNGTAGFTGQSPSTAWTSVSAT